MVHGFKRFAIGMMAATLAVPTVAANVQIIPVQAAGYTKNRSTSDQLKVTETIKLGDSRGNLSGSGWKWNWEQRILTLTNMNARLENKDGGQMLYMFDLGKNGGTVIVDGVNYIETNGDTSFLISEGDVNIIGHQESTHISRKEKPDQLIIDSDVEDGRTNYGIEALGNLSIGRVAYDLNSPGITGLGIAGEVYPVVYAHTLRCKGSIGGNVTKGATMIRAMKDFILDSSDLYLDMQATSAEASSHNLYVGNNWYILDTDNFVTGGVKNQQVETTRQSQFYPRIYINSEMANGDSTRNPYNYTFAVRGNLIGGVPNDTDNDRMNSLEAVRAGDLNTSIDPDTPSQALFPAGGARGGPSIFRMVETSPNGVSASVAGKVITNNSSPVIPAKETATKAGPSDDPKDTIFWENATSHSAKGASDFVSVNADGTQFSTSTDTGSKEEQSVWVSGTYGDKTEATHVVKDNVVYKYGHGTLADDDDSFGDGRKTEIWSDLISDGASGIARINKTNLNASGEATDNGTYVNGTKYVGLKFDGATPATELTGANGVVHYDESKKTFTDDNYPAAYYQSYNDIKVDKSDDFKTANVGRVFKPTPDNAANTTQQTVVAMGKDVLDEITISGAGTIEYSDDAKSIFTIVGEKNNRINNGQMHVFIDGEEIDQKNYPEHALQFTTDYDLISGSTGTTEGQFGKTAFLALKAPELRALGDGEHKLLILDDIGWNEMKFTISGVKKETEDDDSKPITGVKLAQSAYTVGVGKNVTAIATVTPSDATGALKWKSSDTSIATVNTTGVITGVKEGECTITAYSEADNTIKAEAAVTVTKDGGGEETTKPITGITLEDGTVAVGATKNVSATIAPEGYTETPIWSSSDTDIATVSNGVVTGVKAGTVVIEAKSPSDSTIKGSCTFTVTESGATYATGITLTGGTVETGKTIKLTPTVTPSDAIDTIAFASSDTNIASVDSNGVVTGVSEGTAIITAYSTTNTSVRGTATVTVTKSGSSTNPVSIEKITVAPKSGTSNKVSIGNVLKLGATVTPSDATETVKWESADPSIATVSQSGIVSGVKEGKVKIKAVSPSNSSIYGEYEVEVTKSGSGDGESSTATKIQSITLADGTVAVGKTLEIPRTISPSDATETPVWSSADTSIATVNANGVVTGKKEGSVKITAVSPSNDSIRGTCTITVSGSGSGEHDHDDEGGVATSIAISRTSAKVIKGNTITLSAELTPANTSSKVKWQTGDSSIATVSDKGVVTGVTPGKAIIRASVDGDSSIYKECVVTVWAADYTDPTGVVKSGSYVTDVTKDGDDTVYTFSDGSKVRVAGDGTVTGTGVDGTVVVMRPDGTSKITYPDGTVIELDKDGNEISKSDDSSSSSRSGSSGSSNKKNNSNNSNKKNSSSGSSGSSKKSSGSSSSGNGSTSGSVSKDNRKSAKTGDSFESWIYSMFFAE